jgi:hypothetical protein
MIMEKAIMKISRLFKVFVVLSLAMTSTLLLRSSGYASEGYALLKGFWQCQEDGEQTTLEFQSKNQLIYNGQPANYQLLPNAFRVIEDSGPADYYYQYLEGTLIIFSPDGSMTYCQKTKKRPNQVQRSTQPQTTAKGWPPPYQRPSGRSTWEDSSPEKLLYKFAGRWDSATSNTLHNIYLKPDGSFEDSYEAGYSGQFTDQGGFQTGNWGTAGNEQAGGRWTIQGSLRQGTITLIHGNGKRTDYRYQVHCRGSECYGSEYFFNGKLYSVKYIYR